MALVAARLAGVPDRVETIHLARYWLQDGHPLLRALARSCATRHVVYTEAEKAIVTQHTDARKVQVVTPGLDLERMLGSGNKEALVPPESLPPGSFVVGTVARLDPQKGIAALVDAFPPLWQRCPNAVLLIVGDGSLRDDLEAQCRQLGIADRVVFTGYQKDAHRYLSLMDVFVMPSLFESWGYTAAEAMAAGVPVVCSDIPGPNSFVSHGRNGLLVPPDDPAAITAAVLELWAHVNLRRSIAEAGRAFVSEHLTMTSMIRAYRRIYCL
jgi:glycosyltransferase involved in cell wall biosynthesis